jgi:hypothetical protein
MQHRSLRSIFLALPLVILAASPLRAEPLQPNLVGVDFHFYSAAGYDASEQRLSGTASAAAIAFKPVLGGKPYQVFNLSGGLGAALALGAMFDQVGSNADVDGFFTTLGTSGADFTLTGKIPDLGIEPNSIYNGTLLEADVLSLELYGNAGAPTATFNGFFRVIGGDLVTAHYLNENDTIGMVSWLSSLSPTLPQNFDFASDFSATTHLGEIGSIPEPASLVLTTLGAAGALLGRRRTRRK